MKDSYAHLWERFHIAVNALASGTNSIQERVGNAWFSGFLDIPAEDFPDDMLAECGNEIRGLHAAFRKVKDPIVGDIMASAMAMTEEEASAHAKTIVSLYDHVAEVHAVELHLEEHPRQPRLPGDT